MYLDRPHQGGRAAAGHRPREPHLRPRRVEKGFGIVVDYYGVAQHLKEALAAYSDEDIDGALQSLKDEIPKLRDRHRRVLDCLPVTGHRRTSPTPRPASQLLADERLRAEFQVKLKQFLATLDMVLPRPEGLPFVNDAKTLAYIQARARNRYRGGRAADRQGGGREGPQADRRPRHLAGHRPEDPADRDHRRRLRRARRAKSAHPGPRPARWSTRSATTSASTWTRTPSVTRSSPSA